MQRWIGQFAWLAAALIVLGAFGLRQQIAEARPNLQLPWPAGISWGINGGYVYGDEGACGHVGADYYAIDFTLPGGSVVVASASGVVVTKTTSVGGYGWYLEVDHGGGLITRYAHLSSFTAGVNVGTWVRANQDIARSGDTGAPDQFHLHFRGTKNGSAYRMEPMSGYSDFGQWGISIESPTPCVNRPTPNGYYTSKPSRSDVSTFFAPNADRGILHEFLSNGSSALTFQDPPWYDSGPGSYTLSQVQGRMAMGDFTGDGRRDIATLYGSGSSATVHIWKSTGSGLQFQSGMTWSSTSYSLSQVGNRFVAGDFSGDGFDDLAIFYQYTSPSSYGQIHIITSSGTSLSWAGAWTTTGSYKLNQVAGRMAAGDFNRDGRSDIAVLYDYGSNHVQIHTWLSSGSALSWSSGFNWDSTAYTASAVGDRFVAGDLNGDGRTDLAALFQSGSSAIVQVWPSSGSSFGWGGDNGWRTQSSYTLSNVAGRMVVTDVTGEGYADLATFYSTGTNSSRIDVWTSSGSTLGTKQVWFTSSSYTASAVGDRFAAGDLDDK